MIEVKRIKSFEKGELEELTSATMNAIQEGIGFGWIKKPAKNKIIEYWKGVVLVPNRWLFVGKYKGIISGSIHSSSEMIKMHEARSGLLGLLPTI